MMSLDEMSAEVKRASTDVQRAYRFAAANPDVMKTIPCYCGCDSLGHTSNYDCYVSEVDEYGWITFEKHGLACSTCVDITEDVMSMLRDGKSSETVRAYVETTYGKLASPSTHDVNVKYDEKHTFAHSLHKSKPGGLVSKKQAK